MALLDIRDLTVTFGGTTVLSGVSFTIESGEKVGLIGSNGAGKTTIIRTISGEVEPDGGSVRLERPGKTRISLVPQYFPDDAEGSTRNFIIADLLEQRRRLRDLEEKMGSVDGAQLKRILGEYGGLRERYDRDGGDEAESRAETVLSRVGLDYAVDTEVAKLSGGEKNRLQIARALLERPDLLILDEPGNHLDAWGLAWLEDLLREYPAVVLIVSHNRYLLDRVVTRILELRGGLVTSWAGNYSAYRTARLRDAVKRAQDARADQKKLDRLEEMVRKLADLARNRADPAIGQRLRARRTQLERARRDARERPDITDRSANLRLGGEESRADVALEIRLYSRNVPGGGSSGSSGSVDVDKSERQLFSDISALIHTGERVALVGPNGCGKTTLLRDIVGSGHWDDPVLRIGPSMVVGYCSQHQELFDPDRTVAENLQDLGTFSRERIFALVSRYLFVYEDLDRPVSTLSGGELNRLQIARAELLGANFLILDEPTNHLDIDSREIVEEALVDFPGTLLVVSHDRYFLDTVAKRVLYCNERSLEDFAGTFSEFWYSVGLRSVDHSGNRGVGRISGRGRSGRGTLGSNYTVVAPSIEDRLMRLEAKKVELERRLTAAYDRNDLKRAAELSAKLQKTARLYDKLYQEWE